MYYIMFSSTFTSHRCESGYKHCEHVLPHLLNTHVGLMPRPCLLLLMLPGGGGVGFPLRGGVMAE
jgi:hypothetical protein